VLEVVRIPMRVCFIMSSTQRESYQYGRGRSIVIIMRLRANHLDSHQKGNCISTESFKS